MIKTLVYSNVGLTSWQIGVTAEVITSLLEEKREVKLVYCDNVLSNCYFNQFHNPLGCAVCQSRQKAVHELCGIKKDQIINLDYFTEEIEIPNFNSLNELLSYSFKGLNIGRGVSSSIISYTRDYDITSEKYGKLIALEIRKSINVLRNFEEILTTTLVDEIYIFNGRFAEVWPVIEVAKSKSIDFYCIESGSPLKYELFKNSLPHGINVRHREIIRQWEAADEKERKRLGAKWFEQRKDRTNSLEIQFANDQSLGKLPTGFNRDANNVVIFNSSEDELKAIQEWQSSLYNDQNEAIKRILEQFKDDKNTYFYLRVHPNLGKVKNKQLDELRTFDYPNLILIEANEDIDSYALMMAATKVVCFGSSTGIEATFWGAISILLGKSFYMNLDAVYNPESYKELFQLIEQNNLAPLPSERALPYGYYMMNYGIDVKNFKFDGVNHSYFNSNKIPVLNLDVISKYFRYLPSLPSFFRILKSFNKNVLNPFNFFKLKND